MRAGRTRQRQRQRAHGAPAAAALPPTAEPDPLTYSNRARLTWLDAERQAAGLGDAIARAAGATTPLRFADDGTTSLAPGWRHHAERALAADLGGVRVEIDAALTARHHARAVTSGDRIALAPQLRVETPSRLARTVGHELVHVAQQGAAPRSADGPALAPAPRGTAQADPETEVVLVPPEWLQTGDGYLLVAHGDHALVLPVEGYAAPVRAPGAPHTPPPTATPVATLPTIGKEGAVAVNVGARTGFLVDAGGPTVLWPGAMAAIQQSLSITRLSDVIITHVHTDHIQGLPEILRSNRIGPGNLHFPAEFENHPPFQRLLRQLESDPMMATLGYRSGASYGRITTGGPGDLLRFQTRVGDVEFDYVGLRSSFAAVRSGASAPTLDRASLLTRATHVPSGTRWLYVGDLRGNDLLEFRTRMGDADYDAFVSGARTIVGFQHHLGRMDDPADRAGIADLLMRTQGRTGGVRVIAQSTPSSGSFAMNRSLISGLQALGVEVLVAEHPMGGAVGTITFDSLGGARVRGGTVERFGAEPGFTEGVARLTRLREVEDTLTRYEQHVGPAHRRSADARAARIDLETALRDYVDTTLGNVRTGASRGTAGVTDPAVQATGLARVSRVSPFELDMLLRMDDYRALRARGPHLDIFARELVEARRTGRMTQAGIDALWELEPEIARRLVQSSGLPRSARRAALAELPGQPPSVRTRASAGFFLAIEVVNLAAPIMAQLQAASWNDNVARHLNAILWWQRKGVFPQLYGVNDVQWPWDNQTTTDPAQIQSWLNARDLDYLALTALPDGWADVFTLWASMNLLEFPDWDTYILDSPALRSTGTHVTDRRWSYLTGAVSEAWHGFSLDDTWVEDDQLSRILNAHAEAMVEGTRRALERRATEPGESYDRTVVRAADSETPRRVYESLPAALGRWRFKADVEPRLYTSHDQRRLSDWPREMLLYEFPAATGALLGEVPEGYIVVGGADYNSYVRITGRRNYVLVHGTNAYGQHYSYGGWRQNRGELLLAWRDDLERAP